MKRGVDTTIKNQAPLIETVENETLISFTNRL
jgi:hypothetical protein